MIKRLKSSLLLSLLILFGKTDISHHNKDSRKPSLLSLLSVLLFCFPSLLFSGAVNSRKLLLLSIHLCNVIATMIPTRVTLNNMPTLNTLQTKTLRIKDIQLHILDTFLASANLKIRLRFQLTYPTQEQVEILLFAKNIALMSILHFRLDRPSQFSWLL